MKRFRFTLLTVCLVLLWLGYHDLSLYFNNPKPLPISISELEESGAPREWLRIENGVLDLEQAINPSGRVETFREGPFFVPLKGNDSKSQIDVVVETRRPEVIDTLKTYVLGFNTEQERQEFLKENPEAFHPRATITGMTASWLSSTANRDKLLQLAKEQNLPVSENVVFISEGKQPGKFRGFFFTAIAILGIIKFISMTRKKQSGLAAESSDEQAS